MLSLIEPCPDAIDDASAPPRSAEMLQWRAACAGDPDAFAALCRRHVPILYRFAVRLLDDPAEAEDLVQDTMLKLWQRLDQFDPERGQLGTWLHRWVLNAGLDRLRRRNRALAQAAEPEPTSPSAAETVDAQQRAAAVRAALDALPERQRTALLLCHYQRLSQADAAAVMGIGVRALESLLARGRRRLQRDLIGRDILEDHR